MEKIFRALRCDFATLKQEIAAEVKELKRNVVELGQQVDMLQQTRDTREEELDCQRRELLILHNKNQELQYQLEDFENSRATGTALGVAYLSYHPLLTLSLAFPLHASVAKCWRLNARLLAYEDILTEIEGMIRHYLEANDAPEVGVAVLWEAQKAVVRDQFIAIAARLNRAWRTKHQ
ncbi:hypothetical protein NDU88_005541 [Pleurodeles waltl]|uniref:Uncharacterized protein n=1 Tax=Pleurodeles waltl TaxID=8319 RepID=A0AAV7RIU8_PLEWA|nr:hypothetical protein NDU88_005541 [Pleurodeles waltl]